MKFIAPKRVLENRTEWRVSSQTKAIVKYYAEYTGYEENHVVNEFLKNILEDEDFRAWILKRRNNKRIVSSLFSEGKESELENG